MRIGSALSDLKNFNWVSLERLSLILNREYLIPGLVLSVVVLGSTLSFEPGLRSFMRGLISFLLFFWTIAFSLLTVQLLLRWQDVFLRREQRRDALFHAAAISVLAIPVFIAEIVGLGLMIWLGSYSYGVVLLGVALTNVRFHYRFKAPTSVGRRLLVQIEGFATSLATAEAEGKCRLATEPTPVLYEKFLPYAIALDCEAQWSRQCADALTRPGADGRGYQPVWCQSACTVEGGSPGPCAGLVGDALCAAISSAAVSLALDRPDAGS